MPVDEEEASRKCVSCPRHKSGAMSAGTVSCIVPVSQVNIFAVVPCRYDHIAAAITNKCHGRVSDVRRTASVGTASDSKMYASLESHERIEWQW